MKSSLSLLLLFVTNAYIPVGYSQELHHGVARAIPFTDTGISGDPVAVFSSSNRIYCLVKCKQFMCSSFNFGNRTCELYNTYLCQGVSTLVSKRGFRYFDVETEDFIPVRYSLLCSLRCIIHSTRLVSGRLTAWPLIHAAQVQFPFSASEMVCGPQDLWVFSSFSLL